MRAGSRVRFLVPPSFFVAHRRRSGSLSKLRMVQFGQFKKKIISEFDEDSRFSRYMNFLLLIEYLDALNHTGDATKI